MTFRSRVFAHDCVRAGPQAHRRQPRVGIAVDGVVTEIGRARRPTMTNNQPRNLIRPRFVGCAYFDGTTLAEASDNPARKTK